MKYEIYPQITQISADSFPCSRDTCPNLRNLWIGVWCGPLKKSDACANPNRDRFSPSAIGKGCIRYANPKRIDFELVETMLKQTAQSRGSVC